MPSILHTIHPHFSLQLHSDGSGFQSQAIHVGDTVIEIDGAAMLHRGVRMPTSASQVSTLRLFWIWIFSAMPVRARKDCFI